MTEPPQLTAIEAVASTCTWPLTSPLNSMLQKSMKFDCKFSRIKTMPWIGAWYCMNWATLQYGKFIVQFIVQSRVHPTLQSTVQSPAFIETLNILMEEEQKVQGEREGWTRCNLHNGIIRNQDSLRDYQLFKCSQELVQLAWEQAPDWKKKLISTALYFREQNKQ